MTDAVTATAATMTAQTGTVLAVHQSAKHSFSKTPQHCITLLEGLGVEGDAHCGRTVQHRYDMKKEPLRPNLRQVHLLQMELLDEVNDQGFPVFPGNLGENISTRGIDLPGLPAGTCLRIGTDAIVEVTGLRTPCVYIERFRPGLLVLMNKTLPDGSVASRAGVMGIVRCGGVIYPNDAIAVQLPDGEHRALQPV